MAPPPITPSPHRFITSKPTNPIPQPSTSLRFQHQAPQSSSSQFASVPRFNFSSTQKHAVDNATPATQYSSPLSLRRHLPPTTPAKDREDIEETTSDREDEERGEDDATSNKLPTHATSKRRRINPTEAITISSDPPSPTSPPSTPPLPTIEHEDLFPTTSKAGSILKAQHPPRFVLPSPAPSTTTPSIPSRPPLILPPRSPSPPPEAPVFFSPHRRGQKYVPGGLASTVRDWIVETAQVGHTHAHARQGVQEIWDVKFKVGESRSGNVGSGMILVRGRSGDSGWILAGKGRGDGVVEVGCVVGVQEPTWEVEVEREKWRVAVEWKVLDG